MSNPYQPPTEETHGRSARSWMILSGFLFVALVFMCIAFVHSYRMADAARARAQMSKAKATAVATAGKRCTEGSRGGVSQGVIATSSGLNRKTTSDLDAD